MSKGLYAKYIVKHVDDSEGKHDDCSFFVLDLTHDPYARMAARSYAIVCKETNPTLSKELMLHVSNLTIKAGLNE